MRATFRVLEEDYVDAMDLFARLTPRMVIVYCTSVLALALVALLGSPLLRASTIGALIGGASFTLLGRYLVAPMLARRYYSTYKAIQEEFSIELLDDGIQFTSANATGKTPWSQIHKWRENEKFVLVYLMPRLFQIVPKSIADQGFDLQAPTNGLRQHVGKPA
jgi:YcxB-like protein